jgi:hypothetical protein
MSESGGLRLTSHVGRDLLQSAASFKTDYAVVWEYVVNALQYVDEGVTPKVQVEVHSRNKEIEISDNGRGMNETDLTRFFTMHGENIDRARGRGGRGKFGTGKSAAFGIGKIVQVDTRKGGKRNVIRLTRDAIDGSKGDDVPLDWIVRNESTELPNGTTVYIGGIALSRINNQAVIEYIERHLQAFRMRMPEVAVNDHVCQYREPAVVEEFQFSPAPEIAKVLGDVELVIKVSPSPLPEQEVGVAITAGMGNLVAHESGGVDRKELGNYLFGEIDVPALESTKSTIEPYDASRSLQLNPQHPVCSVLIPFIASKLDEVRAKQVRKLSEARRTEQARRLASEATKIADILNKDFRDVAAKLQGIRAAAAHPGSAGASFGGSAASGQVNEDFIEGTALPGNVESASAGRESSGKPADRLLPKRPAPQIPRRGSMQDDGAQAVDPVGGPGNRSRPRGGFRVEYRELGNPQDRSRYDGNTLTILINLEHPAIKNALRGGGVEDVTFRRLSYEVAFTEYSIALGYEMAQRDPDIPADDLLYEVRSTLNRVAASAAALYA